MTEAFSGRMPGARRQSRTRTLAGVRIKAAGRRAAIAGGDRSTVRLRAQQAEEGRSRLLSADETMIDS